MPKASATATVRLTVEVRNLGSWGEDCSLKQIREQATREAIQEVRGLLGRSDCIRIVGEPDVSAILTDG